MPSILFAWELGANLGHAKPLATIAARLGDDCRVTVAARDLLQACVAFDGMNVPLLQAPVWPDHRHFGSQTGEANYLDLLVQIGFADPAKLAAVTGAWLALLDLAKPDAIVADHSPALLLAAYIREIPVVHVGTGFTMPPVNYDRLPPLRPDRAPIMPESRIVATMAGVASQHAGRVPRSLLDIFHTRGRVVFGCQELDAYAPFRNEPVCLPPEPLPVFVEPPVEPRLFVYLGPEVPNIDRLIQVLAALDIPLEVYLRGELTALSRFLSLRGHVVHEKPPSLAETLPKVSHVIAGGGAFTCHAALTAGRPLLSLPLHGEAELNTTAMQRLGVARRLDPWHGESGLRAAILEFVRDHKLLRQSRIWAQTPALRSQRDGGQATVDAIRWCLASRAADDGAIRSAAPRTHP